MPATELVKLANAPRPRSLTVAALSGSMVYARILAIWRTFATLVAPGWAGSGIGSAFELDLPQVGFGGAHAEVNLPIVRAHRKPAPGDLFRHDRHEFARASRRAVQQVNLASVQKQQPAAVAQPHRVCPVPGQFAKAPRPQSEERRVGKE